MPSCTFKPGDEVTVEGKVGIHIFSTYWLDLTNAERCVVYSKNSNGGMAFLTDTSKIKPYIRLPNQNLGLFLLRPTRKNWKFSGYVEAVVAAKSRETAVQISPAGGLIKKWPEEEWADSCLLVAATQIGIPLEGIEENQVISKSYQEE